MKRDFIAAGVAAGLGLVAVVVGAATGDDPDDSVLGAENELNGTMLAGAIMLVGVAPAFTGSGVYGWKHTRECREAQAAFELEASEAAVRAP